MRMLLLAFRQSIDHDTQEWLKELDVKGFTKTPKVFGLGKAGTAFNSMPWSGSNCMILAPLKDERPMQAVDRLREFCDRLAQKQEHPKVPLRVFPLPCLRLM